jgi:hypothetical protein
MALQPSLNRAGALVSVCFDFGQVVMAPAIVPFFLFHFAVRWLPLWGQAVVSVGLLATLLIAVWYLTGERVNQMIRAHHGTRTMIWFPLAASLGMLVFAMYVFSSISTILIALGVSTIVPSVPPESWNELTNLYLWHFLASVPGFKIPDTLKWPLPFQYSDRVTGALLLLFQLLVIAPVINVFVTWGKIRKEISPSGQGIGAQPSVR